jgi:hypothetical protein
VESVPEQFPKIVTKTLEYVVQWKISKHKSCCKISGNNYRHKIRPKQTPEARFQAQLLQIAEAVLESKRL